MSRLAFFLAVIGRLVRVAFRRLRHAPLRPSWTIPQEAIVGALRANGERLMALPPAVARRRSDALQGMRRPRRDVRREDTTLEGRRAVRFAPAREGPAVDLLYFTGGAYAFGSPESYAAALADLAAAVGGPVTAPVLRLAPEHPFPAAVDDAAACGLAFARERTAERRLVFAGDSAGGALAIAALLAIRDAGLRMPDAGVLISPWVDLSASSGSVVDNAGFDWGDRAYLDHWAQRYLAGAPATDPRASPVFADLRGLPPLRILVGGAELCLDQAHALADRARACGGDALVEVWSDMVHGFWMMPPAFPAAAALARIGGWAKGQGAT